MGYLLGLFNITETSISENRKTLSTEIYNLIEDGLIIVPARDRIKIEEEVHRHGIDFMFLQDSFNMMSLRLSGTGDLWLNQHNMGQVMQGTLPSVDSPNMDQEMQGVSLSVDSPNMSQEIQGTLPSADILTFGTQARDNSIDTSVKQPNKTSWIKRVTTSILAALGIK